MYRYWPVAPVPPGSTTHCCTTSMHIPCLGCFRIMQLSFLRRKFQGTGYSSTGSDLENEGVLRQRIPAHTCCVDGGSARCVPHHRPSTSTTLPPRGERGLRARGQRLVLGLQRGNLKQAAGRNIHQLEHKIIQSAPHSRRARLQAPHDESAER